MSVELDSTRVARPAAGREVARPAVSRDVALIDLIDRLLTGGVVLSGEITLAVADIDLVHVGLRALISSVCTEQRAGASP